MVSHSSHTSLSSFYLSLTSSSSPSSPPSSPDSSASSASSTLALVPFLWEEKPGVLKKEMQMRTHSISEGRHDDCNFSEVSSPFSCPVHAPSHTADSCVLSSKRPLTAPRSNERSESVPRLRPPPRLSQPSAHAYAPAEDDLCMLHHHHHCSTSAGVRSKVMLSLPFHKRRHHRTPSLEDDPFWMAMVACTNDEDKGSCMRFKGRRDKDSRATQRSDSWLTKRVQGHSIHFEQCMPRPTSSCTTFNAEKSVARNHFRRSKTEAARLTGGIKSTLHADDQHDCMETGVRSDHIASKAFKALNIAKSEVHSRCKVLLQQQSSPVDISCSMRRSKKHSFNSKHKLPDVFGCKSDGLLIIPP